MTYNWNNWLDKFNILHLHEFPQPDQSENGLTYTGELHVLWKLLGMKSELPRPNLDSFMLLGIDGEPLFLPTPLSSNTSHMSLDNIFGVYTLRELYWPSVELPTLKWYKPKGLTKSISKRFLRPDVVVFNALLNKIPFIRFIARPILFLGAKLSFRKPKNVTSGKVLWFAKFGLLSLSKDPITATIGREGLELIEKLAKPIHGEKPFIDIFDFYFKNPNHPLRLLIREYYARR